VHGHVSWLCSRPLTLVSAFQLESQSGLDAQLGAWQAPPGQCFVWGSSGSLTVGEAVTPEFFMGPHSVGARRLGINFSRPDVGEMWGMLKTVYNGSLTCIQV